MKINTPIGTLFYNDLYVWLLIAHDDPQLYNDVECHTVILQSNHRLKNKWDIHSCWATIKKDGTLSWSTSNERYISSRKKED